MPLRAATTRPRLAASHPDGRLEGAAAEEARSALGGWGTRPQLARAHQLGQEMLASADKARPGADTGPDSIAELLVTNLESFIFMLRQLFKPNY